MLPLLKDPGVFLEERWCQAFRIMSSVGCHRQGLSSPDQRPLHQHPQTVKEATMLLLPRSPVFHSVPNIW